jgi:hypothetical protein
MPLAVELTDVFLSMFNPITVRKLADTLSTKKPYSKDRPINSRAIHEGMQMVMDFRAAGGRNYEELLKRIEDKTSVGSQSDKDSFHFLFSVFYGLIHKILVEYQNESYRTLYQSNSPWFHDLKGLMSPSEPTWIFSLNHDLYVECLAIDFGIPITYGNSTEFVFPISNLDPSNKLYLYARESTRFDNLDGRWIQGQSGINLVRLHGGLAEQRYRDAALLCDPTLKWIHSSQLIDELNRIEKMGFFHRGEQVAGGGENRFVTGPDGTLDVLNRSMLTGGNKYSVTTNEKKGEEKLKLLTDVLKDREELLVIGYGFGDEHINTRISNAMLLNPALKVVIVDPFRKATPDCLRQFDYKLRVLRPMAGAAVWMTYASTQKWDTAQMEAIKASAAIRAGIAARVRAKYAAPTLSEALADVGKHIARSLATMTWRQRITYAGRIAKQIAANVAEGRKRRRS